MVQENKKSNVPAQTVNGFVFHRIGINFRNFSNEKNGNQRDENGNDGRKDAVRVQMEIELRGNIVSVTWGID